MAGTGEQAFAAIADPTRRAILTLLGSMDEVTVGDLARNFPDITRANVSAHLRVLRAADLVTERRQGQFRIYSLGPNKASEVVAFLQDVYAAGLEELTD